MYFSRERGGIGKNAEGFFKQCFVKDSIFFLGLSFAILSLQQFDILSENRLFILIFFAFRQTVSNNVKKHKTGRNEVEHECLYGHVLHRIRRSCPVG